MNHPFVRFIAAILLSIITAIAIRTVCIVLFGTIVNFFANFSFMNMILTGFVFSIGTGILSFVAPLLLMGLHWAGRGSKWISALPILMFVNYFIGDCLYLFTDAYYGVYTVEMMTFLHENAGGFYTFGAIVTAILMFGCYVAAGAAMLFKED